MRVTGGIDILIVFVGRSSVGGVCVCVIPIITGTNYCWYLVSYCTVSVLVRFCATYQSLVYAWGVGACALCVTQRVGSGDWGEW